MSGLQFASNFQSPFLEPHRAELSFEGGRHHGILISGTHAAPNAANCPTLVLAVTQLEKRFGAMEVIVFKP